MNIQENISLREYTTFKIGGEARYFAVIKNIEDLKQAVGFATQNQLPVFVLGGGSNLLVSDEGVNGLVLKMEIKGVEFHIVFSSLRANFGRNFQQAELVENSAQNLRRNPASSKNIQVTASAGEVWDELVEKCVEKGLYGLENLSYIPGTVGASVVQNIGAYGVEIKDVVNWVEVFNIQTGEIKKVTGTSCDFGYRDSVFKKPEGKNWVVIRVCYNLQKNGKLKTDYKDIQNFFNTPSSLQASSSSVFASDFLKNFFEKLCFLKKFFKKSRRNPELFLTPQKLRQIIIKIRQSKLPDWKKVGTAGSFFKNPIITKQQLNKILEKYPELPHYNCGKLNSPQFKIPLAYVLDKVLGLNGCKEGNVGSYQNQPLVLINCGNANCEDVNNFVKKIKKEVKEKTGLDVDEEVVKW